MNTFLSPHLSRVGSLLLLGAIFAGCGSDESEVCVDGQCRDYKPALGCNTCPCNAACGGGDSCCPGQGGGAPVCVNAKSCPP